jgi:hypothetical protein
MDDSCRSARRKQRSRNVPDGRDRFALDSRERVGLLRGVQRRRRADVITERRTEQCCDTDSRRKHTDSRFEPNSDSERHIVSADRCADVDIDGCTVANTERHRYPNRNRDTGSDSNTHSDADPDSNDNVDPGADANADCDADGDRDADAESVIRADARADRDAGYADAVADPVPVDVTNRDANTGRRRTNRHIVHDNEHPERQCG